jgi:NADPH:quinone reductase-like Zn-dependent oxidoreductase
MLLSPFVSQKLGTFVASENAVDLAALGDLVEAGTLTPAIDRTYALAETAAAIRYVQQGHARGKVVVSL